MIKAVRFDEEKHKKLLQYIVDYKDPKDRKNESEAIRFLVQTGFEYITGQLADPVHYSKQEEESIHLGKPEPNLNYDDFKQEIIKEFSINQQSLNIDSIKKDIVNEVMGKLNQETLNNLTSAIEKLSALPTAQVQYIPQPQTGSLPMQSESKPIVPKPEPVKKKVEIPADTNPLLANLLANANR